MHVIGFTRDSDGLMRIILTQPYVCCKRLATKSEINEMVMAKGFRDNWSGQGVNYISDRIVLEDMHPANVFIVHRNIEKFPDDFLFKLTENEANELILRGVSQSMIPPRYNTGGMQMFAFTEQGVAEISKKKYKHYKLLM